MAHKATLNIGEKEYTIIALDYSITQQMKVDSYFPSHFPQFGQISMTLLATDNSDLFFYEWMADYGTTKEVQIYIDVVNKGKTSSKCLHLEMVRPTFIKENYNFLEEKQMTIQLTLTFGIMAFTSTGSRDKKATHDDANKGVIFTHWKRDYEEKNKT